MKTTNTDLRAEFDNMFYFDTGYRGERIEALNNDTETLWNWIQANHISRKDAVSKSEVEKIIDYSPKTQLEDSENQDTYHEGYEQCLQDMKDLLTKVDKPNKEK